MKDFHKIGFKGGSVVLRWQTSARGGLEQVKHELESRDVPAPGFHHALQGLGAFIQTALEIDPEGLTIQSVSINHEEDGRRGFVVTALKAFPGFFNAPLIINTPHVREPASDDDVGPGFAPDDLVVAVDRLEREANRYLNGERAQRDMFPDAA